MTETAKTLDPKLDIWEIQPRETPKAAKAFSLYLNFGEERSLQKVADELHCSYGNVRKWSERWSWVRRAAAYEAHLVEVEMRQFRKQRKEMRKRHLNISKVLQNVTTPQLTAWQAEAKEAEELRQMGDPNWKEKLPKINTKDLLKILETGLKQEQILFGEPTEIVQNTTTAIPVKSLSEEIEEYLYIFKDEKDISETSDEDTCQESECSTRKNVNE